MAIFEIPLRPTPQTFRVQLAGVTYQFALRWLEAEGGGWVLDIVDANGGPLVFGVPLVTGANLLAQYRHLGFGGGLYVQTDHDPDVPPTFENLGVTSHLYFVTA